jgi:D-arabinose 1-dehydrogenase-like Zn-dependent alcohol dehydrogenase
MSIEYTVFRGVGGIIKGSLAQKPQLGPKDILIRITHTGFCASDVAYVEYGIVLGHEGVGIVEAIGSDVTQFKVGERAGGGYHRGSCGHCSYCLSGEDIWCYERSIFGETDVCKSGLRYADGEYTDFPLLFLVQQRNLWRVLRRHGNIPSQDSGGAE